MRGKGSQPKRTDGNTYSTKTKNFLTLLAVLFMATHSFAQSECQGKITGMILDQETKQALPFATVKVMGSSVGSVANEEGFFEIPHICEPEVDIEIRFLGYKTIIHHHDLYHPNPIIYLAPENTELESVIVEEDRAGEITSLSVRRKEIPKPAMLSSSVGELTGQFSGVSLLNTGTNIFKPIIHGLHSNRVLVINDGIRHAYQVWGEEHAPEIEPSHVGEIEVVKGAGTVKYGSDALGGVILYNSKKPAFNKKVNGSVGSSYRTNGRAVTGNLSVSQGLDRFAWSFGTFGLYQGDKEAPNYTLSNTGKQEFGGSFNSFLHRPLFDLQISGSYLKQEVGILRAAIVGNLEDLQNAVDNGIPNPTNPFTYKLQNPRQNVGHSLLKADLSFFPGKHLFKFQYGIQRNIREEFDVRRGELNNRPVISLKLWSHNLDAEWIQPTVGRWNGNTGIQYSHQNSINKSGSNVANFIPDYKMENVGVFTVQSYDLHNATIELGIRFDYQTLGVVDTIRRRFTYANKVSFSKGSFTLGATKQLNESTKLFTNLGSAWRPPNVAELYAFGYYFSRIQFGLWRYDFNPNIYTPVDSVFDQTLRPVSAEQSYKWVTGLEVKKPRLNSEFIFYANRISNYIFLRPHGVTVNIAGTFPYFLYSQTDAYFIGSDWDVQYAHSKSLSSEIKIAYVYAREFHTGQAFLEIPPFNVSYLLDYTVKSWSFGLNLNYTARQWNAPPVIKPRDFGNEDVEINPNTAIFDFMNPPNDYFLVGSKIGYRKKAWNIQLNVDNIFNISYRMYTDRLRYFGDAPGRNFSFVLEYSF